MIRNCDTCKHKEVMAYDRPCFSCEIQRTNWEPNEPSPEPAEVFIRWNQESIERQRCNLLKNSVPGSDIKPGRPSPYLVGAKKSKWRKWDEEKPERHDGELEIIATVKLSKPNSCNTRRFFHRVSEGFDYIDKYFVNVYWRYSRKPPKEYRK